MKFYGLIIAGGQGRRLGGVRKADIRVGGTRLIERVVQALDGAADPILVATGPSREEWTLPPGCRQVRDLEGSGGGPLAGLAAGVAALRNCGITKGVLVSAAVDTPFLPADYVHRLSNALAGAQASYGAWGESFYPPNAAWQLKAIADLPERAAEVGSLKALHAALKGCRVDWEDCPDNPFTNVNTPEDLQALEQRANRGTEL